MKRKLEPERSITLPADLERKTDDEAWTIYQDTLRGLAQDSDSKRTLKELVELSLRAYCRTLDPYSYYDDYATWRKSEDLRMPDFLGVGVTLLEGREDDIICDPYPERTGGASGHRWLGIVSLGVAEHSVRGATLLQIKTWLAESTGASVKLRVRHRDKVEETVTVAKERIGSKPVSVEQGEDDWRIELRSISERSLTDLRDALRSIGPGKTITLDLRGCPGGPVPFAVSIASLFLPANTVIGKLETIEGTETLVSTERAPYRPARLKILQDRFTASAAELIIVALLNHRPLQAESYGEKTYGKGVTQRRVKVSDKDGDEQPVIQAGILTVTDSRIYGPKGEFWDETGLRPLVRLSAARPLFAHLFRFQTEIDHGVGKRAPERQDEEGEANGLERAEHRPFRVADVIPHLDRVAIFDVEAILAPIAHALVLPEPFRNHEHVLEGGVHERKLLEDFRVIPVFRFPFHAFLVAAGGQENRCLRSIGKQRHRDAVKRADIHDALGREARHQLTEEAHRAAHIRQLHHDAAKQNLRNEHQRNPQAPPGWCSRPARKS